MTVKSRPFCKNLESFTSSDARVLPPGMRLVALQPQHAPPAARLMTDCFVAREPMTRALVTQETARGAVRHGIGRVADEMMHAAAANGTSLAVVAPNDELVALCANYQVGRYEPPNFPTVVGAIGALLGALYESPMPEQINGGDVLDVGILAVDERFSRRGIARHLLQATIACASEAGYHALTAGATSVSQDLFAACGFCSWGHVPYAVFTQAGAMPFAAIQPFSARYPDPAAHLMGRLADAPRPRLHACGETTFQV